MNGMAVGNCENPENPENHDNPGGDEAADPRELCVVAVEVAVEAAKLVALQRDFLAQHGSLAQVTTTKSSPVDPVTAVDKAAEARIVERLRERRPDDAIFGEEGANIAGESNITWIIDPIDGTVNFLYGQPMYAVSVGVAVGEAFVAGAVVNVATGDIYRGATGEGAWVARGGLSRRGAAAGGSEGGEGGEGGEGEVQLCASHADDPATALVATGFSYSARRRQQQAELLTRVLPRVRDIRRSGSAALDLCQLAEGRVDAYYEHGTHPWDYAAAAVIAQEAGAVVRHPGLVDAAEDAGLVCAAAPRLWNSFADLLRCTGATRGM